MKEGFKGVTSFTGSGPIDLRTTYAFIDGAYVRASLDSAMRRVFAVGGDLAPNRIAPPSVFRGYFYDCLDDQKKPAESEAEFNARIDEQKRVHARLRMRHGMHLRLGTMRGAKRREQKEVDILLAVDMLTHGFNRTMTDAILVAGDLDFRPVVETLVRQGIFVGVWYDKDSAARELPGAADFGREIDWHQMYDWNSDEFRTRYRLPRHTFPGTPTAGVTGILEARGSYRGQTAEMIRQPRGSTSSLLLRVPQSDGIHWYEHEDRSVIEGYFTVINGDSVDWGEN